MPCSCRRRTHRPCRALHLPHEENPHADQQQHREPGHEDAREEGLLLVGLRSRDLDTIAHQIGHHPDVLHPRRKHGDRATFLRRRLDHAPVDRRARDPTCLGFLQELGVLHGGGRRLTRVELVEYGHQHHADDHPDREIFEEIVQGSIPREPFWPCTRLTDSSGECSPGQTNEPHWQALLGTPVAIQLRLRPFASR